MNAWSLKKNSQRSLFTTDDPGHEARELTPRQSFLLKSLWAYPLFAAALFMLSSVFIDSVQLRLICSAVLGFFPWRESALKIYSGRYRNLRTQLLVLLQVLCTSVSSGYSIERSLELVRPVIEHTFGRKSVLVKPLINLENNLRMHVSLEEALHSFGREINFPETIPIFHALAISGKIGNNSLAILRSSCQMLSEMNAVESEISALNAGKNAEDTDIRTGRKCRYADLALKFLPQGFTAARHELFSELSHDPKAAYDRFIRKQIVTTVLSLLLAGTVLCLAGKPVIFALFFAVIMPVLNNRDIHHTAELKREYLMKDIPLFMCLMSTLLEAGMQLPKAIEICSSAFEDKCILAGEIKSLRAMILSGSSASDAVERFSLRIQIPEAQSALLLVARYGRLGSSEVLNLLSLQASACWNLCRNAARKKQEREA